MATAVYKVNYQGLRKRESYNEIVDYLENKQEKINYPNRFAKQIRNSPQLSNLLDGEGMGAVEMEQQQMKAMEHEEAEHAVRQAALSSGGTAQVLRAAATQTDKAKIRVGEAQTNNPRMASTGSQAWKPNVASGSVQTNGPETQIFDMTLDDNVDVMMDEIEAVSDQQKTQTKQKQENITRILQSHLGNEVTPDNLDFAHQLAQQSASSSSNQPMQDPESQIEPKGRRGRPRKTQQSDEPPKPMIVNQEGDQIKRQTSGDGNGNGKARGKPKRRAAKKEKEPDALGASPTPEITGGASSSSGPAPDPEPAPKAKAKAKPAVAQPKKTITKEKPSHDTTKDTNASPKYWARKNVGYLIDQLQQHHSVRFTKEQLKGKNKLKKGELLDMIKEKLGI